MNGITLGNNRDSSWPGNKREGEACGHQGGDVDESLELMEIVWQLHPLLKGTAQGARSKRGIKGGSSRGQGADSEWGGDVTWSDLHFGSPLWHPGSEGRQRWKQSSNRLGDYGNNPGWRWDACGAFLRDHSGSNGRGKMIRFWIFCWKVKCGRVNEVWGILMFFHPKEYNKTKRCCYRIWTKKQ